ncbi:UNVERIFIED_CONTAM: hypothetical protein GTU68_066272 [Idotea baltica]|nr:hypothetical protein [Idotea baltica]
MSDWAYAYGKPTLSGDIKSSPDDFEVIENLALEPTGEGEHIVLQITKQRQNTDTVAKALARHANVAYRDVGYSGLKDFNAITQQWFSIYQPKAQPIDWGSFDFAGVQIDQVHRHNRKIKRGTHQSNLFKIKIRNVLGDFAELEQKITQIQKGGVPNYFGEQRFGRNLNNMRQAEALLIKGQRFKDRNLKSILYSAARSWMFNTILSERIKHNNWNSLCTQEPANLNGTNSVFIADNDDSEQIRLTSLDIHPTAPMWGKYKQEKVVQYSELHKFEQSVIGQYSDLCTGLEKANLNYQRRPIRMQVNQLLCTRESGDIVLSFNLLKGQFATSVMRELCLT